MVQLAVLLASLVLSEAQMTSTSTLTGCVTRDVFGSYNVPERGGQELPVHRYTLTSGQLTVQVMEYGATVTALWVPDCDGHLKDVILGFDTLEGYLSSSNPYFGATVGRVANRIGRGQFSLDGVTYQLFRNDGNNTLHGGLRAFDKKLWTGRMEEGQVVMEHTSSDGEEGFPGQVTVSATYSLDSDNTLVIQYRATTSKRTPINLTNHGYFNLAGHDAGAAALYNHTVTIKADLITETDSESIPTGNLVQVEGTEYDLRQPRNLGLAIQSTSRDGFDNNFVLPLASVDSAVAVMEDPGSGRYMEVRTSQPGLQFYTSNSISSLLGKAGATYTRHAAFCLEAQNFPDAVNHEEFPNSIFGPEDVYFQVIKYKFGNKKC